MKNIQLIYKRFFLLFLMISFVFISCEDDDSIARRGKPTISVVNKTVTVLEGETATFDFNVEYPVNDKIDIRIDVLDENGNPMVVTEPIGDPTSGNGYAPIQLEDINVPYSTWFDSGAFAYGYLGGSGYVASIDPYAESFQLNIETIQDLIPEGVETINFRLTSTSLIQAKINEVITVNIENFVGEDLITNLRWDGDYLNGVDACDFNLGLDLDLELYFNGTLVATSYPDCPEQIIIPAAAPDGMYTLDASLWTTNGNTAEGINVPAILQFAKAGVFIEDEDLSSIFPINDGGLNDGNPNAIISYSIMKSGNTYTVTDPNSIQVAQGKMKSYRIDLKEKTLLKNNK